jgi:cell volume regulation protein A
MEHLYRVEYLFVGIATLLMIGVFATKFIERIGMPCLLVFLIVGMLSGSEGLGGIYFDNPFSTQALGVMALIYILFAGGLDTNFKNVKQIAATGLLLSTLGVFLTTILTGIFAAYILELPLSKGLLLGAIVSSTDAPAIFAVLRAKNINLRPKIQSILEFESGSNDPMAVILTTILIGISTNLSIAPVSIVVSVLTQIIVGIIIGVITGKFFAALLNRLNLYYEGLYPVLSLCFVVLVYGVTQRIYGNGFLAVYINGLVLGNERFVYKKLLLVFHDGIAWLMQVAMFISLGLLVFPSQLLPSAGASLAIGLFIMLIARPATVFLLLIKSSFQFREKLMIAWVGLRGSVPIILATYPLVSKIPEANLFFNIVFFIVISSLIIQGSTIPNVAAWLKIEVPHRQLLKRPQSDDLVDDLIEFQLTKNSPLVGKSIIELNLPEKIRIILMGRNQETIIPRGSTVFEAGDNLVILDPDRQMIDIIAAYYND